MNVFEEVRVRIRMKCMQVAQTECHLRSVGRDVRALVMPRQWSLHRSCKGIMVPYQRQGG